MAKAKKRRCTDPYAGKAFDPLPQRLVACGFLKPHCPTVKDTDIRYSIRSFSDGSNLLLDEWASNPCFLLYDAPEDKVYLPMVFADGNVSDWLYSIFGAQLSHVHITLVDLEAFEERIDNKEFCDAFRRQSCQKKTGTGKT